MKQNNPAVKFYEDMYGENRVWSGPQGFLGFLYNKLKRFELHRVPAAVTLIKRGKALLDIGCGDGGLIALAKSKNMFNSYFGIDLAEVVVKRAKKNILKKTGSLDNVKITTGSLDSGFNFKNSSFDSITCIAVLEHIFDPYFGIREINRILKKGGTLILELPNLVFLPRRISVLFGVLPITAEEEGWDGGHLHYFTFHATHKLLENNGFIVEYSGSTGIFHGIRNVWPSLLGGNILVKAVKIRNVK